MKYIRFEWDNSKREANIQKHNVDFLVIEDFEWNRAFIFEDVRKKYSEKREVAFAPIRGRLYCVVFTARSKTIRIISLRKANHREVQQYEKQIQFSKS